MSPTSVQRNGLAVLRRIPGLAESLGGLALDYFHFYTVLPEDKGVLAELDSPKRGREATGYGTIGIRRSVLQRALTQGAETTGVEIKWGHHLKSLEQTEDGVILKFANGAQESVSFVVGCDGLHSDTRKCLFGEQPADFTGLTQVCRLRLIYSISFMVIVGWWICSYARTVPRQVDSNERLR